MDENLSECNQLQKLQSNITSLFESLVNEKNEFKGQRDKLASFIENLENEITKLRKENELLRKSINETRRVCETCVELKEKLTILNKRCGKLTNEMPSKVSMFPKLLIKPLDELGHDDSQGRLPVQEDTNSFRSASEGSIKSLIEQQACDSFHKSPKFNAFSLDGYSRTSTKNISDEQPEEQKRSEGFDIEKIKADGSKVEMNPVCSRSTKLFELVREEFHTPRKVDRSDADFIDSPFRIAVAKKEERSPLLLNRSQAPASPNQCKRKVSEFESGSPGKVVEKKLFLASPNQKTYGSAGKGSKSKFKSNLKLANSVEVEISLGGVRKLKQTQLNFEFYKSKNNEENNVYIKNISGGDVSDEVNDDVNKQFGEDDLILGSPKHLGNPFEEFIKNFRKREQENDKNDCKSVENLVADPDETFVNSFYLGESAGTGSEESKSTKSPQKTPSRSPEYNSVPYLYKGSPVRKKSERMKLPGQICMECNKYYKAVLGQVDEAKLQKMLNECSKHREKHYNLVHTPQGYWKPFLTATMDSTMQDR